MKRQSIPWLIIGSELAIFGTGSVLQLRAQGGLDSSFLWLIPPLAFGFVGALVATRRPENRLGWIYLLPGGTVSLSILIEESGRVLGISITGQVWTVLIQGISSLGWVIFLGSMVTLAWLYFPTGSLPSPRWRPVLWTVVLSLVLAALLDTYRGLNEGASSPIFQVADLLMVVSVLASVGSLFFRYRRSSETVRRQIRWIVSSAALVAAFLLVIILTGSMRESTALDPVLQYFLPLVISLVPASAGIAILRHRLFDIDLIIRRTLVYGLLTATLGLVYFGAVTLLQNLFAGLSGQVSPAAIALSTLAIAALFTPLRRRIQHSIDRRFYRRRYDAERALASFGLTVRNEVDPENLSQTLLALVEETMQPESVTLWIKG